MVTAEKIVVIFVALALSFSVAILSVNRTYAIDLIPIGGKFLPGAFDIFTPVPLCGNTVTVETTTGIPVPLVWVAPIIYDDFNKTPLHAGTNMVGAILPNPNFLCPMPILIMFGSSLRP